MALLDRSERHHPVCVEALHNIGGPLVTCEAVIAESCYLLRHLRGAAPMVLRNVSRGVFQVAHRLADRAASVASLMDQYRNQPMALADACLTDLADQLGSGRILTLDRNFEVYRWRKRRRFELMIAL